MSDDRPKRAGEGRDLRHVIRSIVSNAEKEREASTPPPAPPGGVKAPSPR
jgi:hypothetical protein